MRIRTATDTDVTAMSEMLEKLVVAGRRKMPADAGYVRLHYVDNPHKIRCTLAEDEDGNLLGFQSLIRAVEGNAYGTPVGWGIIGTHVSPDATRTGVGTKLFGASEQAAIDFGLTKIEAFIRRDNAVAQAYYERMGFRTYRHTDVAVCKAWIRTGS
jgi:GNAT superfamily N-acetyltransferase